jgi:hypothetical protein
MGLNISPSWALLAQGWANTSLALTDSVQRSEALIGKTKVYKQNNNQN